MNCSTPSLPVYHQLPESTQTHVHLTRIKPAVSDPCFLQLFLKKNKKKKLDIWTLVNLSLQIQESDPNLILIHLMEKAMAPHSSTLAWKIPWMGEPGGLQSMASRRVGHDWATSLLLFTFMHWRRKWQPTPVFLPGESQGWGSLVGCHLWGHTESDMTEAT